MASLKNDVVILMADDDDDDYLLTKKALKDSRLLNPLFRVKDGEELLNYLTNAGKYSDAEKYLRPGVILLDLNMPKKDGLEALREIKSNKNLSTIPIVIFTTSKAEADVYKTYELGVNSFITKPVTFDNLIQVIQALGIYWFKIVTLPNLESPDL